MKLISILLFTVFISMTGCSSDEKKETNNTDQVLEMLEVSIKTPETININEEVTIEALVTQGEENVDDANEVKFEIWKSDQDKHEMLEAKHQTNGSYTVTKTFVEDGTYFIVAHVTARDMHTMPRKDIIVGKSVDDSKDEKSDGNSNEGHNHQHAHSNISIELGIDEEILTNREVTLSAKIQSEGQPLTDATVRFEVWKENEEKHEFIDAIEESKGEYKTKHSFSSQGTYMVNIHVNKGEEIHEHQQDTIDVK